MLPSIEPNYETLVQFNKLCVSNDMIQFLADKTVAAVKIQPTPAADPTQKGHGGKRLPIPSLISFIKKLVTYSNVQTPTLMATSVYLTKLRSIIPNNVRGMETTRHRLFLGCLILSAKSLNDSSPSNKCWAKYTNGLISLREVNTIERELLDYFNWNVNIKVDDLISSLMDLLVPFGAQLARSQEQRAKICKVHRYYNVRESLLMFNAPRSGHLKHYLNSSNPRGCLTSIPSIPSSASVSSVESNSSSLSSKLGSQVDSKYAIPYLS